jgi:hypothetical protein
LPVPLAWLALRPLVLPVLLRPPVPLQLQALLLPQALLRPLPVPPLLPVVLRRL